MLVFFLKSTQCLAQSQPGKKGETGENWGGGRPVRLEEARQGDVVREVSQEQSTQGLAIHF